MIMFHNMHHRRQIQPQLASNSIWHFSVGSIFPSHFTLPVLLSWFLGPMKRVVFQLPFVRFNRRLQISISLKICDHVKGIIYTFIQVWLVIGVMLVTMTLISTCFPWIHYKITNIIGNTNQPEQHAFTFNELSARGLAIMANVTGHTGLNILIIIVPQLNDNFIFLRIFFA